MKGEQHMIKLNTNFRYIAIKQVSLVSNQVLKN